MAITAVKTDLCWVKCSGTRLDGWCRWRLFALWRPEMWIVTCASCRLIPVWPVKTMKLFFWRGGGLLSVLNSFLKEKNSWWSLSRVWSSWRCFMFGFSETLWSHGHAYTFTPLWASQGWWLLWARRLGSVPGGSRPGWLSITRPDVTVATWWAADSGPQVRSSLRKASPWLCDVGLPCAEHFQPPLLAKVATCLKSSTIVPKDWGTSSPPDSPILCIFFVLLSTAFYLLWYQELPEYKQTVGGLIRNSAGV